MVDDLHLAAQANYYVRIWRDGYWLPRFFDTRFPVPRQKLISQGTTNLDHESPRSIMNVLVKAVKYDRYHGKLVTLTEYSVDVWAPGEYGVPGAEPLLYNWRYTPDMQAREDTYR